jgi:hypothetical protein
MSEAHVKWYGYRQDCSKSSHHGTMVIVTQKRREGTVKRPTRGACDS